MAALHTFQEVLDWTSTSKRHLILGNGFSIACRPNIFSYNTLFEQADFNHINHTKEVFEALNTQNFEIVIKSLEDSSKILNVYSPSSIELFQKMNEDAYHIKRLLIQTLANNHPQRPSDLSDEEYSNCRAFLKNFIEKDKSTSGSIFTLNYDLLLYWSLLHTNGIEGFEFHFNDGFNREFLGFGDNYQEATFAPVVTWQGETQSHIQNIHFLHGALHLYDKGSQLQKYSWSDSGVALLDQAQYSIEEGFFPVFVSEGTTESKLDKITHSAYLHKVYRTLVSYTEKPISSIFTYGFSFSENDNHIIRKFKDGKHAKIAVGIYGDILNEENQRIVNTLERIKSDRSPLKPLEVRYYSVETAKVWR